MDLKNKICDLGESWCTVTAVWNALLENAAPGTRGPISIGSTTTISLFGIDLGTVWHLVDPENLSITNITTPGHVFHYGTVTRSVLVENNSIYIRSVGDGVGKWAGFNEYLAGPATWLMKDTDIKRTAYGPIQW